MSDSRRSSSSSSSDLQGQKYDPPTSHQNRSGRRYMFIDSTLAQSTPREAIRVHVMRESHRVRRQIQGSLTPVTPQRTYMFVDSAVSRPAQDESIRAHVMRESHRLRRQDTESSPRTSESHPPPSPQPPPRPPSPDLPQNTRYHSSQARPFNARSLSELNELADRCERLHDRARNSIEQFLPLCRADEAALSSCLALLTYQIPSHHSPSASLASAQLEAQALEILRARFAGSGAIAATNDSTILAIALLSKLERARDNTIAAEAHEVAVYRLIRERPDLRSSTARTRQFAYALGALGFML